MALSKDTPRVYELGETNEAPVKASTTIYEGAAVGIDSGSGYARGLTAGDVFIGFCEQKRDNSAGANGDLRVRCLARGRIQLSIGSLAIADVGKAVYASDDGTFTLTATSNSHIGRVVRFVESGVGIVEFCAGGKGGTITALTDSTGGTANDTLAAVGATNSGDVSATINANFADLAAKVNALIAAQK